MNIIDYIGFNGFIILFVTNIIVLFDQRSYLITYLLFYLINFEVVVILKTIFKEPRPSEYLNKEFDDGGVYTMTETKYGMPSGHSNLVFYSLIYSWLVKSNPLLLLFESVICILTVYQRWKFKKHTIQQLIVGGIIGTITAVIAVEIIKRWKKNYE